MTKSDLFVSRDGGSGRYLATNSTITERFWAYVHKLPGDDACWIWTGAGSKGGGYGRVSISGRFTTAHRAAWLLFRDEQLAPGNFVCHRCDNKRCVRPSHLFQGSAADNTRDMIVKGRGKLWSGHSSPGEANGSAKLTEWQVRQIREELKRGMMTQTAIAKKYGVRQTAISAIKRGETWRETV